jgi:hypothetical protein
VAVRADGPDGWEADPGGGEQERVPEDAVDEGAVLDELDDDFDRGADVLAVAGPCQA